MLPVAGHSEARHLQPSRGTPQHICTLSTQLRTSTRIISPHNANGRACGLQTEQSVTCSSRTSVVAAAKKASASSGAKGFGNPTKSSPSKATSRASQKCPCGSGKPYQSCCGRYHGGSLAPTPEALLRARFSAYSLGIVDYLVATTHKENPEHTGDPVTYARSLQRTARAAEYISLKVLGEPQAATSSSSSSGDGGGSSSGDGGSSSSDGIISSTDDAYLRFDVEWRAKGESGPPRIASETSHFKRVNGAWLYYAEVE